MDRVNKVDFYCGAFLSYLVSKHIVPALIESSEKSRQVQFCSNTHDYNLFVKYASKGSTFPQKGKETQKWPFVFTDKERDYLLQQFFDAKRINYVVLICANENFQNTLFAVLKYEDAIKCLGFDEQYKTWRINVKHTKGSPYMKCHGTALNESGAIKVSCDMDKIFSISSKQGSEPCV